MEFPAGGIKPTFLLSKGQRGDLAEKVLPQDLLFHYGEVYRSRLIWEGIPEDIPDGYVSDCLFTLGGCAPIRFRGEWTLIGAAPAMFGPHGYPVSWNPVPSGGAMLPDDVMRTYEQRKAPALWMAPLSAQIMPLCEIMARAYNCMTMSIQGMQQPVVLQSVMGGEINAREADTAIEGQRLRIPVLEKSNLQAGVLDLGGKDHTQNLISTINALDCEILARMGIKSAGTEKASGVTREETLSVTQELQLRLDRELRICRKWCELPAIRKIFPDISVRFADALEVDTYGGYTDKDASMSGGEESGNATV